MSPNTKTVSRVSSLDELLARCTVANDQHLSQSACVQPIQIVTNLGLPYPGDATNAELNALLPVYTDLLREFNDNAEASANPLLDILHNSSRDLPDASIILLYFIEFPFQVRTLRANVSNISECNVDEQFTCADLVDEIAMCGSIVNWCRDALSATEEHHAVVLASCITILNSINRLPKKDAKKCVKKYILCVKKNASHDKLVEGFQQLRSDLADVAVKLDVTRDASVNCILFQMHTLVTILGEDVAMDMMKNSTRKEDFEKGLTRHRHSFSDAEFQMFRTLLASENQSFKETVEGSQVVRSREALKEFNECARNGCVNEGTKRCIRCMVVSYCSKDCQVADWKAGHKKACKKTVHSIASASVEAVQAARSMTSIALRSQDDFLLSNQNIDYRIVLPSGTQDLGVVFGHPMGKTMFKMWRSKAPEEPTFVNRMYEMLAENSPDKKILIRKQLKAEYGVDPLKNEAKKPTESVPTEQQMANSLSSNMIFYPESPLQPGETPSGAAIRGTVGHETMFMVTLSILEGRVQNTWTNSADSGPIFGDHTSILLSLLDACIAQNMNETHRAESQTLQVSEKKLRLQISDLERMVKKGDESFLFIPLEQLYYNLPHATIKGMISVMIGNQTGFIEKIMAGYNGARVWTHKKGPHPADGSRPPDVDLIGPQPFKCGLRLQCGMTSAIAIMFIHMLLVASRASSAAKVFIFPHGLVFASPKGADASFDRIIKGIISFPPGSYKNWMESWCTSGKECVAPRVDGIAAEHLGCGQFMKTVLKKGCTWYPLFSDDSSRSIVPE